MDILTKKVIFIDLDGTLINTKSGATFPKGIWDMNLNMDVLDQLKKLKPLAIMIATNQGGISLGIVDQRMFEHKLLYVLASVQEYVGHFTFCAARYCPSNDQNDPMRKPSAGMLTTMAEEFGLQLGREITTDECIMIGDASGGTGQFSDTDKLVAERFGCDYMDVKDFVALELPETRYRIVNAENFVDHFEVAKGAEVPTYTEEEVRKACEHIINDQKINVTYVPAIWEKPHPITAPDEEAPKAKKVIMKPKTRKR